MQEKINENSFSGQSIYVGIDAHLKSWKLTVMSEHLTLKSFSAPPDCNKLGGYLRSHYPGAIFYSAYEAGFSGFWLHRQLLNLGIKSIVVNPADIPTTDKERKQKEDVRDSHKIAQSLRAGQLRGIYVPSEKTQHDRSLLRTRDALVKDLRRSKHRVKSLLYFEGIDYPDKFSSNKTHWSKVFIEWLDSISFANETGKASLNVHLESVRSLRTILLKVNRQLRELSRSTDYKHSVELLVSVPGIGWLTAIKLLTEIGTLDRFARFDQLCSFVGLVPSTRSSGEHDVTAGITPRSNSTLRAALIESAWIAVRNDPALLVAFQKICNRMPANRAIVRIAKKLLSRIVYVLRSNIKYEKNVVR